MKKRNKKLAMRKTERACQPCNRPFGVECILRGVACVMCPECVGSDFRIDRVLERVGVQP